MTIRQIASLSFASLALWLVTGCDRGDREVTSAEADESNYRLGQQLVKQGRSQEALSAYLKVIARRGESAPESHLEAGLLYLQQIKDPLAAIYHFRKYLELQPNSRQAVYVKGLVDTAKREFARTLPAQPLESQTERLDMAEQLDRYQRENDQLKAELAALRGSATAPTIRVRKDVSLDSPVQEAPPETHTHAFLLSDPLPVETATESPVSLAPETPAPAPPAPVARSSPPPAPQRSTVRSVPTAPAAVNRRHVISKGDTLFSLAQKYYGNRARWRDIFNANRDVLPTEHALRLGMEIKIP
jgi:nucleoid-associated protein YgaU